MNRRLPVLAVIALALFAVAFVRLSAQPHVDYDPNLDRQRLQMAAPTTVPAVDAQMVLGLAVELATPLPPEASPAAQLDRWMTCQRLRTATRSMWVLPCEGITTPMLAAYAKDHP